MSQFNDKIKTGYDNIADIWFEKREWYIEQPSMDAAITHLAQGATILDVGCGSGKPIATYLFLIKLINQEIKSFWQKRNRVMNYANLRTAETKDFQLAHSSSKCDSHFYVAV